MTAADPMWGSDSPHAEKAAKLLNCWAGSDSERVSALTMLVLVDEVAEFRRQYHSDLIDFANAVSTLAGALESREPVYAEYRPTWRDRLRVLFRGRL